MAAKADPGRGSLEEFNATCDQWRGIRDRSADLLGRVDQLNSDSSPDERKLIADLNRLARSLLDRNRASISVDFHGMRTRDLEEAEVLLGLGLLLRPYSHYTQPIVLYKDELTAILAQLHRFATTNELSFSQQVKIEFTIKSLAPDAARGRKLTDAGKKGHETVYGTEEAKAAKWLGWKQACDGYRASHPEATKADIERWVARDFDVSTRTVRTRCQISPKQPQKN